MTSNCRVVRNIFWKHFYRIGIFTRWLFLNTTKPNSWARSCWPRRNDVLSSVVAFVTNLGMLRKTRHWSFKSWTLDVKSVPSHCRQAHRNKHTHTHTQMSGSAFIQEATAWLAATHHNSDVFRQVFGTSHQEIGECRLYGGHKHASMNVRLALLKRPHTS